MDPRLALFLFVVKHTLHLTDRDGASSHEGDRNVIPALLAVYHNVVLPDLHRHGNLVHPVWEPRSPHDEKIVLGVRLQAEQSLQVRLGDYGVPQLRAARCGVGDGGLPRSPLISTQDFG